MTSDAPDTLKVWRELFYGSHWADDGHARKVAFQRVRKTLVEKNLVEVINSRYRISTGEDTGT
jgi:hypothetical protein